jgi:hypothetical protein
VYPRLKFQVVIELRIPYCSGLQKNESFYVVVGWMY